MDTAGAIPLASRVLSTVAAAIDRMALGAARVVIDRTLMPDPDAMVAMLEAAAFYCTPDFRAEPRRFFAFLDRPEPVPDVVVAPLDPRVRGRARARIVFASPYRPANPAFAAEHARLVENHWVHAETWSHDDRPARGTIVLLHGFGMGGSRLDAIALMAPALFASGLDVVLFALPLHGPRSPKPARFSGQLFASPDVVRLNEAMAQAAHDLTALLAWLRSRTRGPVGLLGMSLGGYVAALLAGLVPDLDFVVPIVAPVCFGDLAYRFMAASAAHRGRAASPDRDAVRDAFRVHSPLAHAVRVARERLLILAAHGDRIVPAEHPRRLEAHWNRPRTVWFSGSHLAPFGRGTALAAIRRFLCDLDVLPAT